MIKELINKIITLFVVCLLASGGLAFTYAATKEKIEKERLREQLEAAEKALPQAENFQEFKVEKRGNVGAVYKGEKNGEVVGYAVQVSPRGFGGPINLMVGIDPSGKVVGIKVVEHLETPGLGGEIEKDWFRNQFVGKSLKDKLKVKEDIDAIMGATISSRGVTEGVREALEFFKSQLEGR
jgi:electron transport complex protein RnfG